MISRKEKRAELYDQYLTNPAEFFRRLAAAAKRSSNLPTGTTPGSCSAMIELIIDVEEGSQDDRPRDNETLLESV
jgi:hypothetical protein